MTTRNTFNLISEHVDTTLNADLANRTHGFVLIVCEVDGTLIGGDTCVLSNLDPNAAIDVIHTASQHLHDEEDGICSAQSH